MNLLGNFILILTKIRKENNEHFFLVLWPSPISQNNWLWSIICKKSHRSSINEFIFPNASFKIFQKLNHSETRVVSSLNLFFFVRSLKQGLFEARWRWCRKLNQACWFICLIEDRICSMTWCLAWWCDPSRIVSLLIGKIWRTRW